MSSSFKANSVSHTSK